MGSISSVQDLLTNDSLIKMRLRTLEMQQKIILLKITDRISAEEVYRLLDLIQSPDQENWIVAEEIIKQKEK